MSDSYRSSSSKKDSQALPLSSNKKVTSIGYYELENSIGEGNFAKVRLATHTLTGQKVAVKIIDKAKIDKETTKKLFREVRIMKLLNHPHIVKLYEVIDTPKELYLIIEYASGGEVFDYLVAHGKFKEVDARKKFRQIISAIEYCHSLHVIHRDLKAENLLLDANLDIKIADFGFSNQFNTGQNLNTFCGSPPYAAPELFQGLQYSGPEVDIWSLGVILYVLTTGSLPFDGSTLPKLRARVLAGKFKVPFYMSNDCEKLIKKMLVIEPNKRASIDSIKQDKWFVEGFEMDPLLPVSTPLILTDEQKENVLDELEDLGLDREAVKKALVENAYDGVSAAFCLVAEKNYKKVEKKEAIPEPSARVSVSLKPEVLLLNPGANSRNIKIQPIGEEAYQAPRLQPIERPESAAGRTQEVGGALRSIVAARAITNATSNSRRRAATVIAPSNVGVAELKTQIESSILNQIVPDIRKRPVIQVTERPVTQFDVPEKSEGTTRRNRSQTVSAILQDEEIESLEAAVVPRTYKFTFGPGTTSEKEPETISRILLGVLKDMTVKVKPTGFKFSCKLEDLEFEIEICKIPRLSLFGLRMARLSGDSWIYKSVMEEIISKLEL